ncbi:MAG: AAA domain-containing protein [Gemmataceae bacterium]
MTARQRTAGAADTALPPKPVPLPWEEWFRAASAEQQKEILALARRQGLVYVHQTPLPANGAAKDHPPEESFLARLLAGHVSALPPVQPQPIEDGDLDEAQREAVARALATPDVFLLEGLPGSGKTRVTAEIIRRACRLGRRVLFVAARSCSLDAVLGALSGCPETLAVRRTGPEEVGAQLPPAVQALTLPHLGPAFRAHIAQTAAALAARPEYHNGDGQETAERLQPALAACLEHEEQARQLEAKIATVPQRVRAESAQAGTALAARVLETRSRFEERRRALEQERQTARANAAQAGARREALQPQLAALRPLAEARRTGRWWSGAWWKAVFRGDVAARMAELEEQERQAGADLAAAEQAGHALDARRAETENEEAACVERLIQAESDRQGAEIEEALRRVRAALAEARERWHAMLAELGLAAQEPSEEGLGQARQEWTRRQDRLQARRQFNRDWAAFLHGSADELVRRLPDLANLIAAPLDGFDLHPEARRFDLLILEDAHLVTETDLLRLSRAANHWVLIADHQPDTLPLGKKDSPVRLGEANVLRSRCFHKLWQHLHGDLTRSPYAWRREQGRLCCHLRAVRPEEQSRLEIERLADFPEVELRILPTPQPALAQIVFPPQMTMAQAKQFIFRELQEVAVQRLGRTAWVREEPDRFVCRLVPWVEQPGGEPIELEKGVREWADESHSDHIERGAGWTRPGRAVAAAAPAPARQRPHDVPRCLLPLPGATGADRRGCSLPRSPALCPRTRHHRGGAARLPSHPLPAP